MDKDTFKRYMGGNGERGVVPTGEIPFADAYAVAKEMKRNGETVDFAKMDICFTDFSARVPKQRTKGKTEAERIADAIHSHCSLDTTRKTLMKPMYDSVRNVAFATDGRSMVLVRPHGDMFAEKSRAECGYQEEALNPNWTIVLPDFDCAAAKQTAYTLGYVTNGDDTHNQIGAVAKIFKAIEDKNDDHNDIRLNVGKDDSHESECMTYNPVFFRDCLDSLFRMGCTRVRVAYAADINGNPKTHMPVRFFGEGGDYTCEAVLMPIRKAINYWHEVNVPIAATAAATAAA